MALTERLIYRVLATPPFVPPYMTETLFSAIVDRDRKVIKAGQHVIADNVAEYYAGHVKDHWVFNDVPNWAPPWKYFFLEWIEPRYWRKRGGVVDHGADSQVGVVGYGIPIREITKGETYTTEEYQRLAARLGGGHEDDWRGTEPAFAEVLCDAEWIVHISPWITGACAPFNGRPAWIPMIGMVAVDKNGKYLHNLITGNSDVIQSVKNYGGPALGDMMCSIMHIMGLTFSFAHCKNVRHEDTYTIPHAHWFNHHRVPQFKTRTLCIDPMHEVTRKTTSGVGTGGGKSLHICRGHFATYTKDKPLMGKHIGTFWRSDHTRGSKEFGEVKKTYDVKAPSSSQETN